MAKQTVSYIKEKFETGDMPTQQDFIDLVDTLDNTSDVTSEASARTAADTTIQSNVNAHTGATNNPHQVTADQVGAYTKTEVDGIAATKANQATTYTKTEVDGAVSTAVGSITASTINVYTKPETDARIQAVVDTAPAALDTLNELAAALGDDANFAGTVTTQLGLKANQATTYTKTEVDGIAAVKAALTANTFTGVQTFGAGIIEKKTALTTNNIDLSLGTLFTKTIVGATTFTVSNVAASGNSSSIILELTNGGSAVVTWFSGVKWAGGTAPVLTSAGVDILGFYAYDGGTTWRGMILAKDSK